MGTMTSEVPPTIGKRVRELRVNREWSREKLAAEAGVSLPTITRLERGSYPRVEHLIAIADVLAVSLDDLVGRRVRRARTGRRAGSSSTASAMPAAGRPAVERTTTE